MPIGENAAKRPGEVGFQKKIGKGATEVPVTLSRLKLNPEVGDTQKTLERDRLEKERRENKRLTMSSRAMRHEKHRTRTRTEEARWENNPEAYEYWRDVHLREVLEAEAYEAAIEADQAEIDLIKFESYLAETYKGRQVSRVDRIILIQLRNRHDQKRGTLSQTRANLASAEASDDQWNFRPDTAEIQQARKAYKKNNPQDFVIEGVTQNSVQKMHADMLRDHTAVSAARAKTEAASRRVSQWQQELESEPWYRKKITRRRYRAADEAKTRELRMRLAETRLAEDTLIANHFADTGRAFQIRRDHMFRTSAHSMGTPTKSS